MRLALASDHAGYAVKNELAMRLSGLGHDVVDCGCHSDTHADYVRFTIDAALRVLDGRSDVALLACGNGYAMAMLANRLPWVRAAVCHDVFTARTVREMGDANTISIGARVVAPELAWDILCMFLRSTFRGRSEPRYRRRLERVAAIEQAITRPDWRMRLARELGRQESDLAGEKATAGDQSREAEL